MPGALERRSFGDGHDVRQLGGPPGWIVIDVAGGDQTLSPPIYCIYVGGAGNIRAMSPYGDVATFTTPVIGQWIAFPAKKILQSGTTATGVIGGYAD